MDHYQVCPGDSEVKASACNVGDLGSIPRSGRSPGEGNGNPLQYSCLQNPTGLQRVAHDWATSLSLLLQFSSVTQLCPTLCDPMNCSTPGLPVYPQLPEFTQTQVHWVSDAIQPSHPLSSPSLAPNSESFPMSQLFAWGGQSTGVSASASVLPMNTQDWSPLGWTGWISLKSKGLPRVTTVQKHQFFGA